MKYLYARGIAGQIFYNSTEVVAYCLTHKPTPDELLYTKRIKYGSGKQQYINTYAHKNLISVKKPLL